MRISWIEIFFKLMGVIGVGADPLDIRFRCLETQFPDIGMHRRSMIRWPEGGSGDGGDGRGDNRGRGSVAGAAERGD